MMKSKNLWKGRREIRSTSDKRYYILGLYYIRYHKSSLKRWDLINQKMEVTKTISLTSIRMWIR